MMSPTLCKECSLLQLGSLAKSLKPITEDDAISYTQPQPVGDLGHIFKESLGSDCELCRFFAQVIEQTEKKSGDATPHTKSLWRLASSAFQGASGEVLTIAEKAEAISNFDGFIYTFPRDQRHKNIFRKRETDIDSRLIADWIKLCDDQHDKCQSKQLDVPNVSVIDCHNGLIVALPTGQKYITLSYVWGPMPTTPPKTSGLLASETPRLIKDSMAIVRDIGLQYLWVDRYCIPQENKKVRNEHLRRMNEIYAAAEMTIISLGPDPSHGLPGVDGNHREQLPTVCVGDYEFWYVNQPGEDLKLSEWSNRAWTFQEGQLSHRILYFTPSYMAFQCRSKFFDDVLDVAAQHWENRPSLWSRNHKVIIDLPVNVGGVWDTLPKYNKRQLTYSSDALSAFLGILNVYEKSGRQISHYWGQPFDMDPAQFWIKSAGLLQSLAWNSCGDDVYRRGHFPSWSWPAWGQAGTEASWPDVEQRDVWVDRPDGSHELFDDFINHRGLQLPQAELSFGIHFAAWVTKVDVIWQAATEDSFVDKDVDSEEREAFELLVVPEQSGPNTVGFDTTDMLSEYTDNEDVVLYALLVADPGTSASQTALVVEGLGIENLDLDDNDVKTLRPAADTTNYSQRVGSVRITEEDMTLAIWHRRFVHLH